MNSKKSLVCALVAAALAAGAAPSHAYRFIQTSTIGWSTAGLPVACNDPGGFTHWTVANTSWYHNTSGQGAGKAAALFNSMNPWIFATTSSHNLHYAGETTAGFIHDGINTVSWGPDPGCSGCLGLTALVLQAGQVITESDIIFNDSHAWTTNGVQPDTWSTGIHEFGHALGLHHTEVNTQPYPTMRVPYFGTDRRTLEADDRSAIQCSQNRYGLSTACIPNGGVDDSGVQTHCCSGVAMPGSTYCPSSGNCYQVCGTPLVNGCVPSGGVDDTLGQTSCCSGAAVSGSTRCLDPADYGTDWTSCFHTCA